MNSCLREARDENGIRKPKAVIQKLKKASSWYVGKLLKMHKHAGFEAVRDAYKKLNLESEIGIGATLHSKVWQIYHRGLKVQSHLAVS